MKARRPVLRCLVIMSVFTSWACAAASSNERAPSLGEGGSDQPVRSSKLEGTQQGDESARTWFDRSVIRDYDRTLADWPYAEASGTGQQGQVRSVVERSRSAYVANEYGLAYSLLKTADDLTYPEHPRDHVLHLLAPVAARAGDGRAAVHLADVSALAGMIKTGHLRCGADVREARLSTSDGADAPGSDAARREAYDRMCGQLLLREAYTERSFEAAPPAKARAALRDYVRMTSGSVVGRLGEDTED